jgi:putative multiple sugar transport system substrate-binding protein
MKRFAKAALVLAAAGTLALTGCGGGRSATPAATGSASETAQGFPANAVIGVALPQKTSENWVLAEQLFTDGLKAAGFTPMVQFANGGVTEQQNQIQAMIEKGAKVLIVGSIDGSQLGTQLANAKQAGAFVMAYERMLTNTPDVDFKIGFDARQVGELQGQSLLDGLKARKSDKTKWNIELIAGSSDDASSKDFFDGAMSVLQPKIDDGTLTVPSGQKTFEQVATAGWKAENVQKRFDSLLSGFYQNADLDGVLSPNDTLARAVITSVKAAAKPVPVLTGQDSEVESVKSIMAGEQYSTIYKDTRTLVAQTIEFVKDLQQGKTLPTNTDPINNGTIDVPAYLIPAVIVTKENAAEVYANDPNLAPLTKG